MEVEELSTTGLSGQSLWASVRVSQDDWRWSAAKRTTRLRPVRRLAGALSCRVRELLRLLQPFGRAQVPSVVADGQASKAAAHVQPPGIAHGPAALPRVGTRVAMPEKAVDQDSESLHRVQPEQL